MRLRVFQSAHGDCLLLESVNGTRVLVDGGIKSSFRNHVLPTLSGFGVDALIDLVYISHIDQDHIGGILAYLDNLVDWRVFRHLGRPTRRPREPELPQIGEIWHNAFHDTITKNRGAIERFLGLSGEILSGHTNAVFRNLGSRYTALAQSVGEGVQVSRRISDKQLNISLNALWNGHLIARGNAADPIELGSLTIEVLGPTKKDLRELRKFWDDWLRKKKAYIKKLRRRMTRDEELLSESTGSLVLEAAAELAQAFGLSDLGDRGKVTEPNLASIMLYVVDSDDTTCLLTGDGHMDDVVKGLEATGIVPSGQGLHVNCLKIAHHGSEHNSDLPHYQRITADNYIFCGNGHSHNPDLRIVDAVIDSRIGTTAQRSKNSQTNNRFKLWFNTDPDDAENSHSDHMKDIRTRVQHRANTSNEQMRFAFQKQSVRLVSL